MKFSDYFSNNFETKEDHMYETLRTHYYRARLEEAKKEVLDLIEREKGKIIDDNEISKFVDKSDVSDIIKRDSNHFEELLDKFEE